MRNALQAIVTLALVGCMTACQTGAPKVPATMPAVADALFTNCVPNDGAFSVRAFDGERLVGTAAAQWIAQEGGDYILEVTDPVGGKLARLEMKGGQLSFTGPLAAKAPPIAVEKDGYLSVDGTRIGLKAAELPCLFGFRLPRAWKLYLHDVEIKGKKAEMRFADGFRATDLSVTHLGNPQLLATCADLAWSRYLVFSSTVTWCQTDGAKREASLTGLGDWQIKWVRLNDG